MATKTYKVGRKVVIERGMLVSLTRNNRLTPSSDMRKAIGIALNDCAKDMPCEVLTNGVTPFKYDMTTGEVIYGLP